MEILYADRDLAVCVKPVGQDAEHQVPQALQAQLGGSFFTVHRLDRNVGGVMVYARNSQTAALLSGLIREGDMVKEYIARVHGTPPQTGHWQDLLFKDSRRNKVFVVDRQRAGVKSASLEYTRLSAGEQSTVQIRLHTGRSHQIRVQFASRGYPLVGDRKYGARDDCREPMLHSFRITFPYQGKPVQFTHLPCWFEGQIL